MKRRSFLKNTAMAAGAAAVSVPVTAKNIRAGSGKSLYELRIYHVSRAANARNMLEHYFQYALIPFCTERNVNVGVFSEYSLEEPVKLYVVICYPDQPTWSSCMSDMANDENFKKATESYDKIAASDAVYSRYETFLLDAFDRIPAVKIPEEKKGLFELRLYESASEDAGKRKIMMFNNEEIDLFLKVGLQPVFFGKVLAGEYMPALIYMVGFKDMTERDAVWAKFGASDEWKKMSSKPEYADTVSNIRKIFLLPAAYSTI
jgi:hypothetical protein